MSRSLSAVRSLLLHRPPTLRRQSHRQLPSHLRLLVSLLQVLHRPLLNPLLPRLLSQLLSRPIPAPLQHNPPAALLPLLLAATALRAPTTVPSSALDPSNSVSATVAALLLKILLSAWSVPTVPSSVRPSVHSTSLALTSTAVTALLVSCKRSILSLLVSNTVNIPLDHVVYESHLLEFRIGLGT